MMETTMNMDALTELAETDTLPNEEEIESVLAQADRLTHNFDAFDTDGFAWAGSYLVTKAGKEVVAKIPVIEQALMDPLYQEDALAVCASLLFERGYKYLPEVASTVESLFSRNFDTIAQQYASGNQQFLTDIVNIGQALIVHEDSDVRKTEIQKEVFCLIEKKIAKDPKSLASSELGFLLEHGGEEIQESTKSLCMDAFTTREDTDKRSDVVDLRQFPKGLSLAREYLVEYLDTVGLPGAAVFAMWMKNRSNLDVGEDAHNDKTIYHTVRENLMVINQLLDRKANVSLLHKLYNISNFARFPVRLLERQAKKPKNRCIFMFYPTVDDNGGIYGGRRELEAFYNNLPIDDAFNPVDVVVSEYGDIDSMKKMMLKFKSMFGKGIHGIVAGHGTYYMDGLRLGEGPIYYNGNLTRIAFVSGPFPAAGFGELFDECFEEDAEILFLSCSAGLEKREGGLDGLARFATRHSRLTYIGPDKPTGMIKLRGELKGGKVKHLRVIFDQAQTMRYKDEKLVE